MTKFNIVIPLLALMFSTAAAAENAAPRMVIATADIRGSQQDCLARGARVMRELGLTKGFETVGATVYSEQDDNTAAIRCEAAKQIAFFVVSGPVYKPTLGICTKLRETFIAMQREASAGNN